MLSVASRKFATYFCLVVLSEAKDLCIPALQADTQVLRFAQDDSWGLCRELAGHDAKRARTNSTTSGVT